MEVHGELKGAFLERVDALPNPVKQNGHKVFLNGDLKEYKAKDGVYIALKDEQTDDPYTNYIVSDEITNHLPTVGGPILTQLLTHGNYHVRLDVDGGSGGESAYYDTGVVVRATGGGGGGSGTSAELSINIPFGETKLVEIYMISDSSYTVRVYKDDTNTSIALAVLAVLGKDGDNATYSTAPPTYPRQGIGYGGDGASIGVTFPTGVDEYSPILNIDGFGAEILYSLRGTRGGDGGSVYELDGMYVSRDRGERLHLPYGRILDAGRGSDPSTWPDLTTPVNGQSGAGFTNSVRITKLRGVLDV